MAQLSPYSDAMQIYPNINDVILASRSPRRRELLGSLGVSFSVQHPDIDETPGKDEPPRLFAERVAQEKASAISGDPGATIISADTIVVLGNTILGKPSNPQHAKEMLAALSGNTHQVITAVCVKNGARSNVFSVCTEVEFRSLSDMEIDHYIATGCPMDKAGAYAIQGGAAHMVRAINGSYTNVVGLPLCELHETLLSL